MEARFRRWASVLLLCLLPASCSTGREGEAELSVRLTYPSAPSARETVPVDPGRGPSYPQNPDNRILVRVLAPHIPTPIEAWFDRSQGQGEIRGVPAGDRIAVEVDEYDNTALSLGTNAPLLGRGWTQGISLSPGERKVVDIPMHDKGTVLTVVGKIGTPGDNSLSGLGIYSLLNGPNDLEINKKDEIYILDFNNKKVKKLDRYGYINNVAGNGTVFETDNVIAINSGLSTPSSIAIDNNNSVYVSCYTSNKIKIIKDETIFNFAGTGISETSPAGTIASQGNIFGPLSISWMEGEGLFFVEAISQTVRLIDLEGIIRDRPDESEYFGTITGPILSVTRISSDNKFFLFVSKKSNHSFTSYYGNQRHLFGPGIEFLPEGASVFNNETIFIADGGSYKIYKNKVGTDVYEVSIDSTAGLISPTDVAVDSHGNLYIADTGNHVIRMVVGGSLQ